MVKYIPIHPHNKEFVRLITAASEAIRDEDSARMTAVKKKFAQADINLFYNAESDKIRVLLKDARPVDFPVSRWTNKVKKVKKE